jgi:chaperonin GroES
MRNLILVERIEQPSAIIIPTAQPTTMGKVVAVGPGKPTPKGRLPMEIKIGDTVTFSGTTGMKTNVGGKPYLVIVDDDVIGLVE